MFSSTRNNLLVILMIIFSLLCVSKNDKPQDFRSMRNAAGNNIETILGVYIDTASELTSQIKEYISNDSLDSQLGSAIDEKYDSYNYVRQIDLTVLYRSSPIADNLDDSCDNELFLQELKEYGYPHYTGMFNCWIDESNFPDLIHDEYFSEEIRKLFKHEMEDNYNLKVLYGSYKEEWKELYLKDTVK
ncbi:hypothetical protein HOE31_00425 [bacterium]|jgi:hypothetical protein|nr:hypothetical protein [bacterium]MBT4121406.1 hypothetical protein [bacterium]MBT4335638.1 hypothetical protein [bacterium]MBT4495295.1 hypothetical protein [bacterium]MBT4763674.1 hypothetical protein [bacterium]